MPVPATTLCLSRQERELLDEVGLTVGAMGPGWSQDMVLCVNMDDRPSWGYLTLATLVYLFVSTP